MDYAELVFDLYSHVARAHGALNALGEHVCRTLHGQPLVVFNEKRIGELLTLLEAERATIAEELATLEARLRRGARLLDLAAQGKSRPLTTLLTLLGLFEPYLREYPGLATSEVWGHFLDGTLATTYPLPEGEDNRGAVS
jgi:hypothetical protein